MPAPRSRLHQVLASCHPQQGHRCAERSSRLVGWLPMCGGLSDVAARLKVEAEWQHYHLVKCVDRKKEVEYNLLLVFSRFYLGVLR
jgi:hypothetical protein